MLRPLVNFLYPNLQKMSQIMGLPVGQYDGELEGTTAPLPASAGMTWWPPNSHEGPGSVKPQSMSIEQLYRDLQTEFGRDGMMAQMQRGMWFNNLQPKMVYKFAGPDGELNKFMVDSNKGGGEYMGKWTNSSVAKSYMGPYNGYSSVTNSAVTNDLSVPAMAPDWVVDNGFLTTAKS